MLADRQEGQDALSLEAVLMTQHLTSPPLPQADLSPGGRAHFEDRGETP